MKDFGQTEIRKSSQILEQVQVLESYGKHGALVSFRGTTLEDEDVLGRKIYATLDAKGWSGTCLLPVQSVRIHGDRNAYNVVFDTASGKVVKGLAYLSWHEPEGVKPPERPQGLLEQFLGLFSGRRT